MKTIPLTLLLALVAGLPLASRAQSPTPTPSVLGHEPRNEAEAQMQNKYADQVSPELYAKWVAYIDSKSPEEQAWLRTLEDQLGSFYFPAYVKDKDRFSPAYNPAADAWAYVKDDPALPRVLIVGDSISRAYTAAARQALAGKANVHRAPANCGPTKKFLDLGEIWLDQNGSNKWDIVIVNFGIHDGKNPNGYEDRLRQVIGRLKKTGAKVFWVRTTPWGKDATVFDGEAGDASSITNPASDSVASAEDLKVIDAHAIMAPMISTALNRKDFTHWSPEAYDTLGKAVATAIEPDLATKKSSP